MDVLVTSAGWVRRDKHFSLLGYNDSLLLSLGCPIFVAHNITLGDFLTPICNNIATEELAQVFCEDSGNMRNVFSLVQELLVKPAKPFGNLVHIEISPHTLYLECQPGTSRCDCYGVGTKMNWGLEMTSLCRLRGYPLQIVHRQKIYKSVEEEGEPLGEISYPVTLYDAIRAIIATMTFMGIQNEYDCS